MTLKQLEYIVKVMECGSITQAAHQMAVSQPSLTKAISNLEEEYGIKIITRKSRGVEFTPEGLDFVLYAKGVLAAVDTYPKSGKKPLIKARLFIASQQLDFIHDLALEVYHKNCNENVFFNLVETDRSDVVEHLLKGNVDLAIAVRTNVDLKHLIWNQEAHRLDIQVLDTNSCYIAIGPTSSFWGRTSVRMEELQQSLQIALDMEEEAKQSFWFEKGQYNGYNNNRIIYVNTVNACESFLLDTDSVCFCSYWTRGCFKNPDIKIIPLENNEYKQELILIRRKGEKLSDAENDFVEALYQKLDKERSGQPGG